MRTDAEVKAAADRTAILTLKLVHTLHALDRARAIAANLEAENHQLTQAASDLIDHYIGPLCADPNTCHCPLGRLTRLLDQ